MSKTEEFIKSKIRIGSNTSKGWRRNGVSVPSYSLPWLTPDQARKAVEIAREEVIEWLEENAFKYIEKQDTMFGTIKVLNSHKLVNDLKQAMKDE